MITIKKNLNTVKVCVFGLGIVQHYGIEVLLHIKTNMHISIYCMYTCPKQKLQIFIERSKFKKTVNIYKTIIENRANKAWLIL